MTPIPGNISIDDSSGSGGEPPAGFAHAPTGEELRIACVAAEALAGWIEDKDGEACGLDTLTLLSFSAEVWSSGALGAPKPFRFYTMALVNGYRIEFQFAESTYAVHTNESASICVSPQFD